MIVGITGTLGAGKGTTVGFLQKLGFHHESVRQYLRGIIAGRGLPDTRDSMVAVANEIRAADGSSALVERLYQRAKVSGGDVVIESIRTVGEADALQAKGDFFLVSVDADQRTRFERILKRDSETDHVSFEQFIADEEREMVNADPAKQNIRAVMERADVHFDNNGTFEDLEQQVQEMVKGRR